MSNNGGPDSSAPEGYAEDIETEVNSYFQQMFSTQLTVDAMIQMLARFKESSERRFILFLFIFWIFIIPIFFLSPFM